MKKAPKPRKMPKIRVDQALVDRGLVETKSKAQALVMAGKVFSGEMRIEKPGHQLPEDTALEVRGQDHPWVSRGGLKLEKGLSHFGLNITDAIALDVGSSTGGFTDVLLANGAKKVFSVDVGRGQLHWRLRTDPRVEVMEGVNARHLDSQAITEPIDIITCDASFIGLQKVLMAPLSLARPGAYVIALIKPQFQVEKNEVGKGGVVRDPLLHDRVCEEVHHWFENDHGWRVLGVVESPITGPSGNVEFLIGAQAPA